MDFVKYFRTAFIRSLTGLLIIASLLSNPAHAVNSEDSQIFISGFNAYQKKDYQSAIERMKTVLEKYPDTPLRDMAIFWLARASFKAGYQRDAARYMSQFFKEYPDSPLKGTVEDELLGLVARFEKGEQLPVMVRKEIPEKVAAEPSPAKKALAEKTAAAKEAAERAAREKAAAEKAALDKLAAEKAVAERAAAEKVAAEKAAAEKAAERAAAEKLAAEKAAREKAEAERLAAGKAAAERAAAEKLAAERAAAEKAAAEMAAAQKLAAQKAEAERLAAEKAARERAEAERLAAEKAAKEKDEAARIAAERAAREKAEAARLAAEKAAREKAEAERLAAEKAAREKAEAERLAAENAAKEKAEAVRIAAERAAREKAAREKAEAERLAAENAAKEKAEAVRIAAERAAREKAEAERLAAEKAAREKAEAERLAAEKAAREKAEAERLAAEKAAREKAEAERLAAEKSAREKAEAERLAAEKAAAEKAAAELLVAERAARAKADAERLAAEKAAKERAEADRLAAEKSAAEKAAAARRVEAEERAARSAALREKAIAEYKSLVDRFPGTKAATAAAAKLKELGIPYPAPGVVAAPPAAPLEKNAQVLSLEVGQYADVDLTIPPVAPGLEVGKRHEIPFEVVNHGNGIDSFTLESGFPAEFGAQFADAAKREMPVTVTSSLAPGERFRGIFSITIPRDLIDGHKIIYPVKVASRLDREASQARDIFLSASAPLMRAVVKTDKGQILPGEKVPYRVVILNIGTATAQGVSLRLTYPPQYEPVGFAEAGFKREMKETIVLDGLRLNSGESREFELDFLLKDEAIAQQELFLRADLVNNELQTRDSFISTASFVKAVSGVAVRTAKERLVVIPGQPLSIPLVVTNIGNVRDDYLIKPSLPGNLSFTFYQDLNRDGIRQANEPIINHVGPLAPKEEAYVILDLATPATEGDGASATVAMTFEPESDKAKGAAASLKLVYSRPVVELAMLGKGGRLKPGEVSSFELNFTNRGSNMAKAVELQSFLPRDLELVASDPSFTKGTDGDYLWKFDELGAGEKRIIKVTFRVKSGTAVGKNVQVKNILKYQDLLGNRY